MTAQDLKNSILQLAVQGKLVSQRKTEASVDLSGLKPKKTNECEFDVPNSWRFAHLETITRGVPSKQYQILESEVKQDGRFPVISQSKAYSIGFTDSEEKLYHHEDPVVIFGDHTTEIKFVDFDFVVGADGVKIFKPITSVITAKFLFYVLRFYSRDLHKVGGYSRHYKFIKNNPIPLPPLAEQERIVAKIEELLPLVSEYDEVENRISALNAEFPDKLRKSILQQAVQGKLTERDPSDEPALELLKHIQMEKAKLIAEGKIKKEKQLPPITEDDCPYDLSDTWVWVRLGDIVQYQGGYAYKSDTYVKQSNNQVVRLGNVKNSALLLSASPVYIPNHIAEETDEYRIVKDTILFTMTGTKGKRDYFYTCKTTEDNSSGCKLYLNQRVGCLRPYSGINLDWLIIVLQSEVVLSQIFATATGNANQANIGSTNTMKLMIPLPPLAEQKRIVARVEELLAMCDALK